MRLGHERSKAFTSTSTPRRGALLDMEQDTVHSSPRSNAIRRLPERYDPFVSSPGPKW